jgi:hypothetical protein
LDGEESPEPDQSDQSEVRPSGIPLGRAFIIRQSPLNEDLIAAVRAVAAVHGDGSLPSIPVEIASFRGALGRFWHDADGRPISISIDPSLPHRAFAVVHEIGHFLDLAAIGEPGVFASEVGTELAQWRTSIERSRRWNELGRVLETVVSVAPEHEAAALAAYRDLPEGWARSYTQYVTIRSKDPGLLAGLAAHREPDGVRERMISRLLHWDDYDFASIAEAIETLFRRLGWRSGP